MKIGIAAGPTFFGAMLALAMTLSACGRSADSAGVVLPKNTVPAPTVTGPMTGGIRTGQPFNTSMVPLRDGYVEEEFLFSGTARYHVDGSEADYTTRIVVRRPTDPALFNGTVVLDWTNVTLQFDIESLWAAAWDVLMGRGFVYVAVTAQKQGADGSPLAVFFWDPVRYAAVSHPGDDYSFDIFSQAALAALDPIVLPQELRERVRHIVATGPSQSAGRLTTYINEVHEQAGVFDGFMPQIAGSVTSTRKDLVPVLWINSQAEAAGISEPPADENQLRYWEIAGPPHTTNAGERYYLAVQEYGLTGGMVNTFDPEVAGQFGELDPHGSCSRSRYPVRYVWSAGIVALHEWLNTGTPPPSYPPITRDAAGELTFDEHGNTVGGLRLPVVDVPIAAYYAGALPPATALTPCMPTAVAPLIGFSQNFTTEKLAALYPTHEDYVAKMEAATAEAVAAGRLLPEHGEDLMRRVRGADITNPLPRMPPPLPVGGGPGGL
jgi:hypothetical protein